jgi:hypothetical protein
MVPAENGGADRRPVAPAAAGFRRITAEPITLVDPPVNLNTPSAADGESEADRTDGGGSDLDRAVNPVH